MTARNLAAVPAARPRRLTRWQTEDAGSASQMRAVGRIVLCRSYTACPVPERTRSPLHCAFGVASSTSQPPSHAIPMRQPLMQGPRQTRPLSSSQPLNPTHPFYLKRTETQIHGTRTGMFLHLVSSRPAPSCRLHVTHPAPSLPAAPAPSNLASVYRHPHCAISLPLVSSRFPLFA
ncbi:uncharacterized protein CC84DRAFT_501471 [Paraphaeosphaeria sporulosa]|uniref:Uncharacterized protein n=1 Tax=Paraphaeosphaeria sporulosa TaxID=1460663 RepID=A0A177CUU6_9PLEO|nr:uncharacterized protein CC84DRAFT_501471 [Paraphaeosphaeria sporulosa]OAG10981.1 hypothetical protein CC84DRAFT_501471 [Paraphaeosphaeria sporulosa]